MSTEVEDRMLTSSVAREVGLTPDGVRLSSGRADLLLRLASAGIPHLDRVRIDGSAVAFTMTVAVIAGFVFGLAPAFQIRASWLQHALALAEVVDR